MNRCISFLFLLALMGGGCVELQYWVSGGTIDRPGWNGSDGGGSNNDNGNGNGGNDNSNDDFAVSLSVSNETPEVNEEVIFSCMVSSGSAEGVRFSYDESSTRLTVDTETGRAAFVVSETDLGIEFSVRCAAENAAGETAISDEITVIATDSLLPAPEP